MDKKLIKKNPAKFIYLEQILLNIKDENIPLPEKLKFIKLFADKLNEFIETETSDGQRQKKKTKKKDSSRGFKSLYKKISVIDDEFAEVFNDSVIPELENNKIFTRDFDSLNETQTQFVNELFEKQFKPVLNPYSINADSIQSFFKNGQTYFVLKAQKAKEINDKPAAENDIKEEKEETLSYEYILIELAGSIPKFIDLPSDRTEIITANEIIKHNAERLLPDYKISEVHSITLYANDETDNDWVLFADKNAPSDVLKDIRKLLGIKKNNIFTEPAYININYLIAYIFNKLPGIDEEYKPIDNNVLSKSSNMFDIISRQDVLLSLPFHSINYIINFLRQASDDPFVSEIRLTESQLTQDPNFIIALLNAIKKDKRVTVYINDDGNVLNDFRESGINVILNSTGMELNSEIIMVKRRENEGEKSYVYFSTRNLNSKNIAITDLGLFTSNNAVAEEVNYFFNFLQLGTKGFEFNGLLVSGLNMKKELTKLIGNEIKNAEAGKDGYIMIKLNKLEDKKLITALLKASETGVKIKLLISESSLLEKEDLINSNIQIKYLINVLPEHSRMIIFYNDGEPLIYASSGDWTKEDLSKKISVAFPIKQIDLRTKLVDVINLYSKGSQRAVYDYLKSES